LAIDNRKDHIDRFGAIVLVAFSALLGLNQVCVKLVNAGLDPVFQAGLRSFCAFFLVALFALFVRRKLSLQDGSLLPGIVTGLLFSVEFMFLFQALDYTSVSRASVLFYTMPFWVTIAAHFLIPNERITRLKIVGLIMVLAGVLLTLSHNASPSSSKALIGDLYCLVAAMCWAGIAIVARTTQLQKSSPEMQLLYQLAISAPILLALAWFSGNDLLREPTLVIWMVFAFQVIVVISVGFLVWFWVLSIYPVANMAVFSFLAPIFGVLFGWLLLDESLGSNVLIALACIAGGIILVNWPKRQT